MNLMDGLTARFPWKMKTRREQELDHHTMYKTAVHNKSLLKVVFWKGFPTSDFPDIGIVRLIL
jgi:hypothetical protein